MENKTKMEEFAKELEELINKHSIENFSNTPDFILADYLMNCLEAYHSIKIKNDNWHTKPKDKSFTPHPPAYPCHFGQPCSCDSHE